MTHFAFRPTFSTCWQKSSGAIAATAGLNRNSWIWVMPTVQMQSSLSRRRCKRVGGALPAARAKYSPGAGAKVSATGCRLRWRAA